MPLKTYSFDAADALDTPEAQADLLADAFASEDPVIVTAALGMIARARHCLGRPRYRPQPRSDLQSYRPRRQSYAVNDHGHCPGDGVEALCHAGVGGFPCLSDHAKHCSIGCVLFAQQPILWLIGGTWW